MKNLESVKNDLFASFADAQMSREEMKNVMGGGQTAAGSFSDGTKYCRDFYDDRDPTKFVNSVHMEGTPDCDGQKAGAKEESELLP